MSSCGEVAGLGSSFSDSSLSCEVWQRSWSDDGRVAAFSGLWSPRKKSKSVRSSDGMVRGKRHDVSMAKGGQDRIIRYLCFSWYARVID